MNSVNRQYYDASSVSTTLNPEESPSFEFRMADSTDIPQIVRLMREVKTKMSQKDWFVDDDETYLQHILDGHGFILLAQAKFSKHLASYFMVKFPGLSDDNLGYHLGFSKEQLSKCVHMDSCVVHPDFRGHHLQSQMASLAEQHIQQMSYQYLLATVHPDNYYSLNSMLRCGYHLEKETYLYGGLPRVIIMKELNINVSSSASF